MIRINTPFATRFAAPHTPPVIRSTAVPATASPQPATGEPTPAQQVHVTPPVYTVPPNVVTPPPDPGVYYAAASPAAPAPATPDLPSTIISGIPDEYVYIGGGILLLFLISTKKRRR